MRPVGPDPTPDPDPLIDWEPVEPDPDEHMTWEILALLAIASAVGFFIGLALGGAL